MQDTSAVTNYDSILSGGNYWFETKIVLNGNTINEANGIMSLSRTNPGMDGELPTVGGALSSELNVTILDQGIAIPRMAEIDVYVRVCNESQQSGWLRAGIYFTDTRKKNDETNSIGTIQITAYDAMMKFGQSYPDTNHAWPYPDIDVIEEMAQTAGVAIDSRLYDYIVTGYPINLPAEYTMREVLENIAASYGGNFVITAEGELMFVPLYGLDPDITGNYLADENGNALVFGNEGWCILV